jgi:hypothetical protein
MSWDIFILDWPANFQTVDDLPKDFDPQPLGPRDEIIAKIVTAFPDADFSDPSWGHLKSDEWWIEVNMGDEDICSGIMLHVRGGDSVVGAIDALLKATGLRALDIQSSALFVADEEAQASFQAWRAFRDHAVRAGQP